MSILEEIPEILRDSWIGRQTLEFGPYQRKKRSRLNPLAFHLSSVHSLSRVRVFATPWTAACQASLSITNSQSFLKLKSIESVMPSNLLILCCPLFLPPSIFPSIRVFSNESVLCIRWPKYWSFSFSISPSRTEFLRTDPYQSLDSPKYITSHNVPS